MRSVRAKAVLLLLGGLLALGLVALAWAIGPGSSEAQQGAMHNCPQPGKWAISVWSGDDGTGAEQAFATCDAGAIAAAYYLVPEDQTWQRWFAGRPLVNTLETLDDKQGVIALGRVGAPPPSPTPTPALGPGQLDNCPQPNKWAISVWNGPDDVDTQTALAICPDTAVVAAYWLDPNTQGWLRYFEGRTDISDLLTLGNLQGLIVLGGAAVLTPTPTATPVLSRYHQSGLTIWDREWGPTGLVSETQLMYFECTSGTGEVEITATFEEQEASTTVFVEAGRYYKLSVVFTPSGGARWPPVTLVIDSPALASPQVVEYGTLPLPGEPGFLVMSLEKIYVQEWEPPLPTWALAVEIVTGKGEVSAEPGRLLFTGEPLNQWVNLVPGYEHGTEVTITAHPASGYVFDHWEVKQSGREYSTTEEPPSITILMTGSTLVYLYFAEESTPR